MRLYPTAAIVIKNDWHKYDHNDHRVMYMKYSAPLLYLWDVGQLKDVLKWPGQQKN